MPKEKLNSLLTWFETNHPELAKSVQKQFDAFSGYIYDQVDAVVTKMQGHHMEKRDFYDPIGASLEDRSGRDIQELMKLGGKGMAGRATPLSGFTISRVESKLA